MIFLKFLENIEHYDSKAMLLVWIEENASNRRILKLIFTSKLNKNFYPLKMSTTVEFIQKIYHSLMTSCGN